MTVTEAERHELRQELGAVMGEGAVNTIMDSLPPMDWRELATKTDLAALEERLDTRFERIDTRFERIDTGIDKRIAKQTYVLLASLAAMLSPFYIALVMALFSGGGPGGG